MVGVYFGFAFELYAEVDTESDESFGHSATPAYAEIGTEVFHFQTAVDITVFIYRDVVVADDYVAIVAQTGEL